MKTTVNVTGIHNQSCERKEDHNYYYLLLNSFMLTMSLSNYEFAGTHYFC